MRTSVRAFSNTCQRAPMESTFVEAWKKLIPNIEPPTPSLLREGPPLPLLYPIQAHRQLRLALPIRNHLLRVVTGKFYYICTKHLGEMDTFSIISNSTESLTRDQAVRFWKKLEQYTRSGPYD
ncbi:hypothetical protein Scep_014838 [Stephania cephalantha]|uniref:Uncharacterized protein n=1 Tax=Stephania cephalantha TaxID=152367 RepID=A0AAP0NZT4_9MAGN